MEVCRREWKMEGEVRGCEKEEEKRINQDERWEDKIRENRRGKIGEKMREYIKKGKNRDKGLS